MGPQLLGYGPAAGSPKQLRDLKKGPGCRNNRGLRHCRVYAVAIRNLTLAVDGQPISINGYLCCVYEHRIAREDDPESPGFPVRFQAFRGFGCDDSIHLLRDKQITQSGELLRAEEKKSSRHWSPPKMGSCVALSRFAVVVPSATV